MNWNTQILIDFQQGKLDLLYRNVYPGLILYAIKYLGEESEFLAEDCVQNAIFSAWERRNKFDSVYTFKALVFTEKIQPGSGMSGSWRMYLVLPIQ